MTYRIKDIKRHGIQQTVGLLFSATGEHIGTVVAWSAAGALSDLKRLANRLQGAV